MNTQTDPSYYIGSTYEIQNVGSHTIRFQIEGKDVVDCPPGMFVQVAVADGGKITAARIVVNSDHSNDYAPTGYGCIGHIDIPEDLL